ncbi:MAG: BatA domain-containing protein [Planctomycetia bacterium]|nr:BatA domain-containing protein [Planctomycetia bacterium]
MSLIHPALIYAAGFVVIPVILHFLLRAKPKKLVFPALRLILMRRRQNVRRMRLRHVWLLLLRMLVILGLVLAVTRPSLPEASYELSTRELITLSIVVAIAVGTYFGLTQIWQRKHLSVQTMAYRRTLLRGGLGVGLTALISLLVVLPYVNRLRAEISAPAPAVSSDLPVAAVFLFDTSLSMQYTQEGKTRLDQAKAFALGHMDSLPPRSRIAVGESHATTPILFQADLVGAKARIQSLAPHPISQPLNDRLRAALALQQQDQGRTLDEQESVAPDARRDRFIREIYVFTDLAATAWRMSGADLLKEELDRSKWGAVYVIDVGETKPQDIGIAELGLSRQSVPIGGTLTVDVALSSIGVEESEKTVELSLLSRDGKLIKQDQQPVKISGNTGARTQLSVSNLLGPVQHGEVRLLSSDPLAMNDVRYFTVESKLPPKLLLVSPTDQVAIPLKEVLAPEDDQRAGKRRYDVEDIRLPQLASKKLNDYSVIVLNSVPALTDPVWKLLHKYVSSGGGLAVILGSSDLIRDKNGIDSVTYNTDAAKTVLPAELETTPRFSPPAVLDAKNLNHPALKKLEEANGAGELATQEVRIAWNVKPHDDANVLIRYTDRHTLPALIERRIGAGRVMMLTTAADLRGHNIDQNRGEPGGWNDLIGYWPFLILTDQMLQYLSGRNETTFNYLAGEEITLRAEVDPPLLKYLLRKPGQQQIPGNVAVGTPSFSIRETDQLGHYDVLSADPQSKFATGFSVNASAIESNFQRLTEDDLTQMFGEKRFALARDIATLQRRVTTGRLGEEVYPLLLIVAMIVFCGEHFVANWFYAEESESQPLHDAPEVASYK